MNNIRNVSSINEEELRHNIFGGLSKGSWHEKYKDSAWVFLGGFSYELTEGDLICVMSQWGEIEDIHLVREKETGKSQGFAFVKYEDYRSTILAVDNFNGVKLLGRTLRCDHVENYKLPKHIRKQEEEKLKEDPEAPLQVGPGHAYQNVALANEYDISRGVDLWAKPGEQSESESEEEEKEKEKEKESSKKRRKDKKHKHRSDSDRKKKKKRSRDDDRDTERDGREDRRGDSRDRRRGSRSPSRSRSPRRNEREYAQRSLAEGDRTRNSGLSSAFAGPRGAASSSDRHGAGQRSDESSNANFAADASVASWRGRRDPSSLVANTAYLPKRQDNPLPPEKRRDELSGIGGLHRVR